MDLLDRVREESGDSAEAHPLGLRESERGKAPPLLLAGMPAPLTPARTKSECPLSTQSRHWRLLALIDGHSIAVPMPSSLGLEGDLDDVELIQDLEEAFGLQFSDNELAGCRTAGDLFEVVESGLPESSAGSCATAMCFYRMRRALQPLVGSELRPKTALRALDGVSVRRLHRIIEQECGLRPPLPYVSVWGCIALALVVALPVATFTLGLTWWIAGASAVAGLVLYRLAPIRLPQDLRTFGDLVRVVSARSIGTLARQGARLSPSDAWAAFTDILSHHSLLRKEAIAPDTLLYAQRKAAS
jgi:hypothetical protein